MATQQRGLQQNQDALLRSYATRLKNDIKSLLVNFEEILKLGECHEISELPEMIRTEQDTYETHVRAANMVRAGESLMKLIADLKIVVILSDFPALNEALVSKNKRYRTQVDQMDDKLVVLVEDMAQNLFDLEKEYYMSVPKEMKGLIDKEI